MLSGSRALSEYINSFLYNLYPKRYLLANRLNIVLKFFVIPRKQSSHVQIFISYISFYI